MENSLTTRSNCNANSMIQSGQFGLVGSISSHNADISTCTSGDKLASGLTTEVRLKSIQSPLDRIAAYSGQNRVMSAEEITNLSADELQQRNREMMSALKPYVERGDYIGFWKTALKYGDPLAQLALDFHGSLYGDTFANRVAVSKLELSFTGGNKRLSASELAALKARVGTDLMVEHYKALSADIGNTIGTPGILSVQQIDQYHYDYFESIGLSKNTYGGQGVPGWLYCSQCDPVAP